MQEAGTKLQGIKPIYAAFKLTPERLARGVTASECEWCGDKVGIWAYNAEGQEIVCSPCLKEASAEYKEKLAGLARKMEAH